MSVRQRIGYDAHQRLRDDLLCDQEATDAPFRETEAMIAACRDAGILAVEMEAAALYTLATAQQRDIICFAHVTNQMGQAGADFEKGVAQGSLAALQVISHTANQWLAHTSPG